VELGGEVPWTLGVVARPAPVRPLDPGGRQTWELALHGSVSADPSSALRLATSPVLLALSDRVALGHFRDGFVLIGVDLGLDRAVGVPAVRGVVGVGWSFAGHDRDGDGIPDDVDACPTLPEDFDGFEDDDGCPEADNDDDGIVDSVDACPDVPGVASPDPRHNGCPDPDPVPPRTPVTATPSVPAGGPRP
jgi:hypothetical protein